MDTRAPLKLLALFGVSIALAGPACAPPNVDGLLGANSNTSSSNALTAASLSGQSGNIAITPSKATSTVTVSGGSVVISSSVGSMASARSEHAAALLATSNVLIAGGTTGAAPVATATLYNPTSAALSATGSMTTARRGHTATLLNNGKVLVTGGHSGAAYLSSAELYDPSAGTFAATGSMAAARAFHSAALLSDGKVLVVGGYDGAYLSSAELYDPTAGTFSNVGALTTARRYASATLLNSGKVLVAGGANGGGAVSTGEIYDSGTFSAAGSAMITARSQHTATKLNTGKVVIIGGRNGAGVPVQGAEIFDPTAESGGVYGTFNITGNLNTARYDHVAVLTSLSRVLVLGGIDNGGNRLSSGELYDPNGNPNLGENVAGTFATKSQMVSPRQLATATLLNNAKVLVAGGVTTGGTSLATAEAFDPMGDVLTFVASGGKTPYSYSLRSGPGSVSSTTGEYTIPTSAGTAVIRATDADGKYAEATVTLSVN